MWMIELLFSGSGSNLLTSWIESYLKKHPGIGYIKAFLIGFACAAVPFELCILVVSRVDQLKKDLLVGSAMSSAIGLVLGAIAVIFLFSMRRSMIKNAKGQLLKQNAL